MQLRQETQRRRILSGITLPLLLICLAAPLLACSVPVCRYALERWRADLYDVVVFHNADLTAEQLALAESLRPDSEGKKPANVHVTLVDVRNEIDPLFEPMWESVKDEDLPRMAVRFPDPRIAPAGVWSGEWSQKSIDLVLKSKSRRLIGEELVKGTSAVWVLLESGDVTKDQAAEKTIVDRLRHLEKTLEISQPDEQDIKEGLIDIDAGKLELSFRLFKVSRNDPAELFFVKSLLHTENDLQDDEYANQPMAFPVFGRGRCLYALIGSGIDNDNIDEACQFLAGPCSCQVKDQNPGVDLLMTTDWDALVNSTIDVDTSLPPLVGLQGFQDPEKSTDTIADTTPALPTQQNSDLPDTATVSASADKPAIPSISATADSTTPTDADSPFVSGVMRNVLVLAIGAAIGIILFSVALVRRQS